MTDDVPDLQPGPLVPVDDPCDVRLAEYRDLKDRTIRRRMEEDGGIFVVEGRVAVGQLLRSGWPVRSLLVDDHQVTAVADLVDGVRARGAPVYVGSRPVVLETVGFALHRGVVAVARRPAGLGANRVLADAARTPGTGGGPPVVAILEGLNDHENIGAVFRNAAAFGVGAVLLDPTCADPLYRRAVRVSAGHVLTVPFARLAPWPAALDRVRAAGFLVAALAPRPLAVTTGQPPPMSLPQLGAALADGSSDPVGAADPAGATGRSRPVALLLGAEGPGLSEAALAAADLALAIPMADGVDSLNVATAAAIAFHWLATS